MKTKIQLVIEIKKHSKNIEKKENKVNSRYAQ